MEDFQQLTPDAETFARVWKRVMPEDSASPIVVHPPEKKPSRSDTPPRPQPSRPSQPPPEPAGDEELLRRLLASMDEGLAGGSGIVRLMPRARPMWESLQNSAGQLRAAWFLLTGQRWQPGQVHAGGGEGSARVRRQYMWELGFSRLCGQAREELRAGDLREIMPVLEAQSIRRRGMLRRMLV